MTTQQGGDTVIGKLLLEWRGGADAPGGGGPDPSDIKQSNDTRTDNREEEKARTKDTKSLNSIDKKTSGYVRNTLGINIGIASILKQSQIFTGTLGTIFQILGALVDVILAPFMPLIVAALKSMAANIPGIQKKAEQIVGVIVKVIQAVAKGVRFITSFLPGKIGTVLKDIFQYFIIGVFLAKLLGGFKLLGMLRKKGEAVMVHWLIKIYSALLRPGGGGGGGVPYGPPIPGPGGGGSRMGRLARGIGMRGGVGLMGAGLVAGGAMTGGGTGLAMGIGGGAMTGAMIGSAIPGIGTAIGTVAGAAIGGALVLMANRSNDEQTAMNRNPDLYNVNTANQRMPMSWRE
tara:strand:+ start:292 stop:1329 length:1038 start_codon:yes stop_codon:yes gene_type:complete